MLDDQREVFAVAGFKLGLDPNTTSESDLDQMLALLEQQKPLLRKYTDDDIGDMTSGNLWMSHAWSGDWYQMIADKPKIQYVVPQPGAVRGNDTIVILSGAKHPIAAHLWLNFNLDANVSAENTNYIGYMGPNAAAEQLIDPAITGDPRLNPPADILAKLVELAYLAPADLDKYTQRWNALRA
jgi:spermidine/putrescine-binding protein